MPIGPSKQGAIRWGLVGTGWIAERFALSLATTPGAHLYAVASRTRERAESFARRRGVSKAYGSYEELYEDKSVDVVYIATPVTRHREDCLACLGAGKPVLCEKPFTVNAVEAREVVEAARRESLFCMEAMWMRFHPLLQKTRELVRTGALGEVGLIQAEISTRKRPDPNDRAMRPDLGGGALLDLGIYTVSLSHYLFGRPDDVVARVKMHPLGVDETVSLVLSYPNVLGTFTASIGANLSGKAVIIGSTRRLDLGNSFIDPKWMLVSEIPEAPVRHSEVPQSPNNESRCWKMIRAIPYARTVRDSVLQLRSILDARLGGVAKGSLTHVPPGTNALRLEAEEVMRCLREGRTESEIMSLSDTVGVLETMDRARSATRI